MTYKTISNITTNYLLYLKFYPKSSKFKIDPNNYSLFIVLVKIDPLLMILKMIERLSMMIKMIKK